MTEVREKDGRITDLKKVSKVRRKKNERRKEEETTIEENKKQGGKEK